jgi:cytochrome c-type biogenesis protein CcmF
MSVIMVLKADKFEAEVQGIMLVVQAALLIMLLTKQNPFALSADIPADGAGLNLLLQNPWMAIHPPILFVGYAGLVIPFAYALAALIRRDYSGWVPLAWPWTLFAWGFLGAGIAIGGFWAYETLGWGGYWGWDPVENSSLVPWLTATALAHGLITQKSRGTLIRWNLIMAPITFSLVLYATFLTRSGVLSEASVHSFTDSGLGPLLAGVVLLSVAALVWLFAKRFREIPEPVIFEKYLSRDFTMLVAILIILVLAFAIIGGTSVPVVMKATMGTDYYNLTGSWFALFLVIVLSLCPLLGWRETDATKLARGLAAPAVAGAAAASIALVLGAINPLALLLVGFGVFAATLNVAMIVRIAKGGVWKLGGYTAHIGVGLILAGIVGSAAYGQTEQLRVAEGQSGPALGYTFTFNGLVDVGSADAAALKLTATRGGQTFVALPRLAVGKDGMVRTPYIERFWNEDIYIEPGEYTPGAAGGLQLELTKGQTGSAGGYAMTFLRFDTTPHDQTGSTAVAAVIQVTSTAGSSVISPTIVATSAGLEPGVRPNLPGSKATVELTAIDASAGLVILTIGGLSDQPNLPTPAVASFEISRKPAINLLWGGVILLMAGTAIAVQRRRLEMAPAPSPASPQTPRMLQKPQKQQAPQAPTEPLSRAAQRRQRIEERRQGGPRKQ